MNFLKSGGFWIGALISAMVLGVVGLCWWLAGILERAYDGKPEAIPTQTPQGNWVGLVAILGVAVIIIVLVVWIGKEKDVKPDADNDR